MRLRKFIKPTAIAVTIAFILIIAPVIAFGVYGMFIKNRSYEQIHPMESILSAHGLNKVCEQRVNGSFQLFGGKNGGYVIYYVTPLDVGTIDKIFVNELHFPKSSTPSQGEISSYFKEVDGVGISATIREREQPNPELCFPNSSDFHETEIKVPKDSHLFTIGNTN